MIINRKSRIRVIAILAFVLGLNPAFSSTAFAWGPDGHKIVALIAADNVHPKTLSAIKKILGGQTMDAVANWADVYRLSHPESKKWHYVDIQITDTGYLASRDCKDKVKTNEVGGDCAIEAIKHFEEIVADKNQSAQARFMALKFIIHFVGDIHQPLHSADNHDTGGNNVKLTWFGQSTDLHKVWDGLIIKRAGLTPKKFASELEKEITTAKKDEMQSGDLEDWVNEAHKVAQDSVYPGAKMKAKLGKSYYDANAPVVDEQLTRAGLRLAKVLDELFK